MATAVSLRGGMFRNRSGSLSELDSCGRLVDKYLKEAWHVPHTNHASWSSDQVDHLDESLLKNLRIRDANSAAVTVDEYLGIRYVLSILQRKVRHGRVTPEQLNSLSWIIFSSVLHTNQGRDNKELGQGVNGSKNHSSFTEREQSTLIGALCDANIDRILQKQGTFPLLSHSQRRHCISENDLSWTVSNNPLFPIEQNELRQAFSTDLSDSLLIDSNLHTRHSGHENLADLNLFETNDSLLSTDTKRPSTDEQKTPGSITSLVDNDSIEPSNTDCDRTTNSVDPADNLTSAPSCESSDPKQPIFFHCESLLTVEPPLAESSIEPINGVSPSQILERTDSSLTVESILSRSSSVAKLPKSVSFADEVGQSLTEVFLIKDDDNPKGYEYDDDYDGLNPSWSPIRKPRLHPSSICSRFTRSKLKRSNELTSEASTTIKPSLNSYPPVSPPTTTTTNNNSNTVPPRYLWCLQFPQPASQYYQFRQRVENGSVSLESITVTQPTNKLNTYLPVLSGTIKVRNISFEKQVWLRLTTDNWQSYTDHMALYNPQLSGAQIHSSCRFDTFTFSVQVTPQLETSEPCEKIEFAIRYVAGMDGSCGQYWDNNNGRNYVIERKMLRYSWSNDQHTENSSSPNSSQFLDSFQDYGSSSATHFNPYTPDYRPNFSGFTQFTDYRAWNHFAGESTYY